jgi:hypothetical protein
MLRLIQFVTFVAVVGSNHSPQWTPNPAVAVFVGAAAVVWVTMACVAASLLFSRLTASRRT